MCQFFVYQLCISYIFFIFFLRKFSNSQIPFNAKQSTISSSCIPYFSIISSNTVFILPQYDFHHYFLNMNFHTYLNTVFYSSVSDFLARRLCSRLLFLSSISHLYISSVAKSIFITTFRFSGKHTKVSFDVES